MNICKANYKEITQSITSSIERWIDYVTEYHIEYFEFWENIDRYNAIYKECKGNQEEFKQITGVDLSKALLSKHYLNLLPVAKLTLNNIDNIHTQIIDIFICTDGEVKYPVKTQEWLYSFRDFCVDGDRFLSAEEQNERLKQNYHFDASKKRYKVVGDYKI